LACSGIQGGGVFGESDVFAQELVAQENNERATHGTPWVGKGGLIRWEKIQTRIVYGEE
jgi:hypothetical protein